MDLKKALGTHCQYLILSFGDTELSTHNVNYTDVMKYNEGVLSFHKYTINKLKEEGYEFNW